MSTDRRPLSMADVAIAPHDAVAAAVDEFVAPLPVVMVSTRRPPDTSPHPGRAARGTRTLSVSVAQQLAARLATEHLLSLGHRTVTHLGGPRGWFDARTELLVIDDATTPRGFAQELRWNAAAYSAGGRSS